MPGVPTDKKLGAETFQKKFFNNNPVYLDRNKEFYKFFGSVTIYNQSYYRYLNPCLIYSDYRTILAKLQENEIDEYMLTGYGDKRIKGGFLLITPNEGVVYKHAEIFGEQMPIEDITQAVMNMSYQYDFASQQQT